MQDLNVQLYSAPRLPASPLTPTVRDWVAVGFRHGRLIVMSFVTVMLGVVLFTVLTPPQYEAEVKIMVKRERLDPVVGPDRDTQLIAQDMTEVDLNSEVELLKSRDLLEKVVVENGLHQQSTRSFLGSLLAKFSAQPKGQLEDNVRLLRAVQRLEKDLTVEPIKKTKLIQVTYRSTDPQLPVAVLRTLIRFYFEKHLAVHRLPGALDFFQNQARAYRDGLTDAEQQLAAFGSKNGVVAVELEKEITLRKLSDFESELQHSQSAIKETEERIHVLEQQAASIPARLTTQVKMSDNPVLLEQLKTTLLNLELKRTELLSKFAPDYRPVQDVEAQIEQTREELQKAEKNPMREEITDRDKTREWLMEELAKARTELSSLQPRVAAMSEIVTQYRQRARQLSQTAIVQQDLIRTAKTAEENYLLYSRKQEEARISDALDQKRIVNVSVAEEATVPSVPSSSNRQLTLALGFLLACFISAALAFAVDYLDTSFRTPQEVEVFLGLPVLASLPEN